MPESWDEQAENWDRDEHARFYADQAFASLIEHVDVRDKNWKSRRVLDFGCGTGLLTEKLSLLVKEVIAVDTSQKMIDELRRKEIGNVAAICADIDDQAVRSRASWFSQLDFIVASSVCSFLPNYEPTIGVLSRALSATGYFVQWDWLSTGDDEFGLTLARVSNALAGAGLKRVHVGKAFTLSIDGKNMPVLIGVGSAA